MVTTPEELPVSQGRCAPSPGQEGVSGAPAEVWGGIMEKGGALNPFCRRSGKLQ